MRLDRLETKLQNLIGAGEMIKAYTPRLIKELKAKGRTLKQIASYCGCSIAYVSQCSLGQKKMSNEMLLRAIELAIINKIELI